MLDVLHSSDWLTITNKADKTVEIDITGVIGGSFWEDDDPNSVNTKEKMRAELKAIAEIKADKIIVNIDSPGGSVFHGMSIHDLLAQHKAVKEVRIIGMAASIASVIAQSGAKRMMSDNALFLVHRAMGLAIGNQNELTALIENLKVIDKKIVGVYTKRGADESKVNELMDYDNGNGKWIDAEEAMSCGFIDETFEPMKAAASFDESVFNKLKYPKIPVKMTNDEVKTFGDKLDSFLEKVTNLFKKEEPAAPVTDVVDPAKSELELSNEKVTALEAQIVTLTSANAAEKLEIDALKASLTAKETEANAILAELKGLKNEWVPEGRTNGTSSTDLTAVDKDAVKETIKKSKNK